MRIQVLVILLILPFLKTEAINDRFYIVDTSYFYQLSPQERQLLVKSLPAIHKETSDTVKIRLLAEMYAQMNDNNVWILYLEEIKKLLEKHYQKQPKDKFYYTYLYKYYNDAAYYGNYIGKFENNITYYEEAVKIARKLNSKKFMAEQYNNIAYHYYARAQFDMAVSKYDSALRILDEIGDIRTKITVYNNLGFMYFEQNEPETSKKYYLLSIDAAKKYKDSTVAAMAFHNLGLYYYKVGQTDSAEVFFLYAMEIRKAIGNMHAYAETIDNMAGLYQNRNNYDKALAYSREGLRIHSQYNSGEDMASIYARMASIFYELNKIDSAFYYARKARILAKELGYPKMLYSSSTILKRCFEKIKRYDSAYYYYNIEMIMKDSLYNLSNKEAILKQQTRYEYEKKKTIDDAEHDKKLAIEREEKEKQKIISISSIVGVVMLVLFLGFIYNRLQVTRKQRNIISEQKSEVEKAHHELEEKNHEIMQSITYAKRLQQSILPPPRLVKEYMKDSFVLYMPKDIVAGDFYWIESHNNKIYFAAADCTGHGVPGAMVSMVCHNALNRALLEFNLLSPSLILDKASMLVEETFSKSEDNVQDGMDVSLYCLDTTTLQLEWAGANNPLWMIQNGEFKEIKADKQPVGRYENRKPFTNHVLQLNEGDSLFSITDGYPDQFGGDQGKKYTYKKLREFLMKINDKPMALQKDELIAEFDRWKSGHDQVDDVCIIGVRV